MGTKGVDEECHMAMKSGDYHGVGVGGGISIWSFLTEDVCEEQKVVGKIIILALIIQVSFVH